MTMASIGTRWIAPHEQREGSDPGAAGFSGARDTFGIFLSCFAPDGQPPSTARRVERRDNRVGDRDP
jgi:hypothetical protein